MRQSWIQLEHISYHTSGHCKPYAFGQKRMLATTHVFADDIGIDVLLAAPRTSSFLIYTNQPDFRA